MKRYKVIGNIEKECQICDTKETLLVIHDKELDKIIVRCDTCKPIELKKGV